MWIGDDRILKAGFLDGKKGTVEEEKEEKDREEKDCLSRNKMSKLTIMKKGKKKTFKKFNKE